MNSMMVLSANLIEKLAEEELYSVRGGISIQPFSANNGGGVCDESNNAGGLCQGSNNSGGRCDGTNNSTGACGPTKS